MAGGTVAKNGVDWIDSFMTYTEGIQSPEIYRRWSAITAVGGAMERRVWTTTSRAVLYPNLYTLLVGAPGVGKCLHPDELVLTYDGPAKRAGDVVTGDLLIGPDGKSRRVVSTGTGQGPMYEIIPVKGKSWRCNGNHVLSLRKSRWRAAGPSTAFVTVEDWLKWSPVKKSNYKLWHSPEINHFAYREHSNLDPYFIGVLLGDGDSMNCGQGITITTCDQEIIDMCYDIAGEYGLEVVKRICPNKTTRYGLSSRIPKQNILLSKLREQGLDKACEDKYVPDQFKYAPLYIRMQVLAGLIDTDGSYYERGNNFDFISKSKQLAEDVAFLARSGGLAAYCRDCVKWVGNFSGQYWRVSINGDLDKVPVRIVRKKPRKRTQIKDVRVTGFTIKPIGIGEWAGFEVDGDHQYLLDDFTVTHNTQSIRLVEDIWRSTKNTKTDKQLFHVAPDNVTKAALIDALERADSIIKTNSVYEYHSMLVAADEFGVLVPAHDLEFFSVLNKIFDCPKVYSEERRHVKKLTDIIHPQLCILAGAQPGFLASMLPEEAWSMGFTSRLIMIYSSKRTPINLFGKAEDRSPQLRSLVAGLGTIGTMYGLMQWDPSAASVIQKWAETGCKPEPEHSKLVHYNQRRVLHLIKLSMISAASRSAGLVIEHSDLIRAMDWLFEAENLMPDVFREMTNRSDGQLIQELHFFMWGLWMQSKQKPIHESRLIYFLQQKMPSEKIMRLIEIAERSNIIAHVAGTKLYVPKPKTEHGIE